MGDAFDALVTVHGYNPEGMEGGRDPTSVWDDRLSTGRHTADTLSELGADVIMSIPGGGDYGGKTEAEIIGEYVVQEFPDMRDKYDFILEGSSTTTEENIDRMYDLATTLGVSAVFTVSSKDHTPRVLYKWQEVLEDLEEDPLVFGVCSREPYSDSTKNPVIIEPAVKEPLIEPVFEAMNIPTHYYEEFAEDMMELVKEYQHRVPEI